MKNHPTNQCPKHYPGEINFSPVLGEGFTQSIFSLKENVAVFNEGSIGDHTPRLGNFILFYLQYILRK